MISAVNTAISGLASAGARIQDSANRIANSGNVNAAQAVSPVETVDEISLSDAAQQLTQPPASELSDPTDAMIDLKLASYDFKANLRVLQTQFRLDQALLDITT